MINVSVFVYRLVPGSSPRQVQVAWAHRPGNAAATTRSESPCKECTSLNWPLGPTRLSLSPVTGHVASPPPAAGSGGRPVILHSPTRSLVSPPPKPAAAQPDLLAAVLAQRHPRADPPSPLTRGLHCPHDSQLRPASHMDHCREHRALVCV